MLVKSKTFGVLMLGLAIIIGGLSFGTAEAQVSTTHDFVVKVTQDGEPVPDGTSVRVDSPNCRARSYSAEDGKVSFSISLSCAPVDSVLSVTLPGRHVKGAVSLPVTAPDGQSDAVDFKSQMVTVNITHSTLKHPEWEGQTYITLCSSRKANGRMTNCRHHGEYKAFPTTFEVAYDRIEGGIIVGFTRYENDGKRHWFPSEAGRWKAPITQATENVSYQAVFADGGVKITRVDAVTFSANIDR